MRTSNGSVVQFLYGEDGMDGTAIEAQKLESLRMSPNKFRVQLCLALPLNPSLLSTQPSEIFVLMPLSMTAKVSLRHCLSASSSNQSETPV